MFVIHVTAVNYTFQSMSLVKSFGILSTKDMLPLMAMNSYLIHVTMFMPVVEVKNL